MTIIAENVEDVAGNTTRFLFLRNKPLTKDDIRASAITTLVFQTKHVAGALVEVLKVFQKHNLNMTKLETYMTGVHHAEPVFYVDLEMNRFDETGIQTLEELKDVSTNVQVLGTYEISPTRQDVGGF